MIERIPIVDRDEWLGWRKSNINASEVGAIFGPHAYQTMAGLHATKCGLELPGPDPAKAVIRRGNALEQVVADEVGRLRPEWHIVKNTDYLRDPDARIGCTIDFFIDGDPRGRGVLQTKTVASGKFKREWLGDGDGPAAPSWIILQVKTEMMLADAAFGAVGVLAIGDYEFSTHIIEVPRHKPTEHKIRVAVHAFWAAIEAGQVPELDYARDGELIKAMYRATEPGKVIDLRGDNRIVELLETQQREVENEKLAKNARKEAEAEIRAKIGDAETALVPGWVVTNKMQTQTRKAQEARELTFPVLRTRREE